MTKLAPSCLICSEQPTVSSHLLPRAFAHEISGEDGHVLMTDRSSPQPTPSASSSKIIDCGLRGMVMASITEEALVGEWFYLEEEQPFDRTAMDFYVLRAGEVRIGLAAEVVGTYRIEGDELVITLRRTMPFTTTIVLSSGQSVFDKATDVLSSSAIYTLPDGSDPLHMYGTFVRRFADFVPSADVDRRSR